MGAGSKGTVVFSLFVYLILQLVQGVILNSYLAEKVKRPGQDNNQWYWLIADGILLVFGGLWLLKHNTRAVGREIFGIIPPLPALWTLYLALCLLPRASWLFSAAGTTIDCDKSNFTFPLEALNSPVRLELGSNSLVTVLSLVTTGMLVLLAMAGYSHFGLRNEEGLDFDMAEAALSLVDGVEFLQAFFDVSNCQSGTVAMRRRSNVNDTMALMWNDTVTLRSTVPEKMCVSGDSSTANVEQCYLEAIEGHFGKVIIALACFCFILPVFALWQMRRQSDVQKWETKLRKKERQRRRLSNTSLSGEGVCDVPAPERSRELGSSVSLSVDGPLYNADSEISLASVDVPTEEQKLKRLTTERDVFQIIFLVWDCFFINLAGAVIRFILWIEYKQPISALLAKNILAVLFRLNALYQKYVQKLLSKLSCSQAENTGSADSRQGTSNAKDAVPEIKVDCPQQNDPVSDKKTE